MAAAEARAAWQRAANRCLVQEDRKRAPKLACCPSSSEQQHSVNNGNCRNSDDRPISSFMPSSCNPMISSIPRDIRWCIQLQPNFRVQKDLASGQLYCDARNFDEKEVDDSAPKSKHDKTLIYKALDTSTENSGDIFEPPWMVSKVLKKYSSETGLEELKTVGGHSQASKCRETVSNLYGDKELLDLESFDPAPLKNPQKSNFDVDTPWEKGEKTRPWWQIADENELASLVAEKATQHIENCDLPRPAQTVCVHRTESCTHKHLGDYGGPSSPAGGVSHPVPGNCDHIQCSYSAESTNDLDLCNNNGVWKHPASDTYGDAQEFSGCSNTGSENKQTFLDASERDQILEALRHSQTRAREAEMAAKKANNEKDDVINLLLRQASHLLACNQWLKILQLENIVIQLKHKEHQIASMIPELPWMTIKEKPAPVEEQKHWTRRKGRRQKKGGGFFNTVLFAIGLGLAGAGFLLGWTLGWLLPKS